MNLKRNRIIFGLLLLTLLLSGPITVFLGMGTEIFSVNGLLRASGTIAFSLIFAQIVLGHFMNKLTQILGSKAYFVHIFMGISTLFFILFHPLMYTLQSYNIFGKIVPFLIPMNLSNHEFWISFGRAGFLFLATSIIVAYFRKVHTFRRIWKKVHYVNYIAFYLLSVHAWFTGTDTWSMPFMGIFWIYVGVVTFIVIRKLSFSLTPSLFSRPKVNTAK